MSALEAVRVLELLLDITGFSRFHHSIITMARSL